MENFYKVLKSDDSGKKEVFYTAMLKTTVANFIEFTKITGMKLDFLTSRVYALFELFKHDISPEDKVLYINADRKGFEYSVFDSLGIIYSSEKKISKKSIPEEIEEIITDIAKQKSLNVAKVILGGIRSLELDNNTVNYSKTVKISVYLDKLIEKHKINIDTGGVPTGLYSDVIGLLELSKDSAPPNFINELDTDITDLPVNKKIGLPETTAPTAETNFSEQQIVEYKSSLFSKILSNKIFLTGITLITALIIIFFTLIFTGKLNMKTIPFLPSASPTPTVTLAPTLTPTPTIDTTLKRSGISINVQNGTQKSGYAKEIVSFLVEKGYKNPDKGNADKNDYEKSVIKIKESAKKYLPLLVSDLKEKIDTTTVETLSDTEKTDVIVILGAQ